MRRLDARLFTMKEWLLELWPGSGHMLASTLRFFGGDGDQIRRIDDKPSALYLLYNMMTYLLEDKHVHARAADR
jgi:hypothetical protein